MSPYKATSPRKNVAGCQNTSKYVTNRQEEAAQNVTNCKNTSKYVTQHHKNKSKLKGEIPVIFRLVVKNLLNKLFRKKING